MAAIAHLLAMSRVQDSVATLTVSSGEAEASPTPSPTPGSQPDGEGVREENIADSALQDYGKSKVPMYCDIIMVVALLL